MGQQVHQGDLRRIANAIKHRLAGEHAANRHAIDAAGQLALVPDFHAMGNAGLVQLAIGGRASGA